MASHSAAYSLNLAPRADAAQAVRAAVREVEADLPPRPEKDESHLDALALLQATGLAPESTLPPPRDVFLILRREGTRASLATDVVAVSWAVGGRGPAMHEVAAGPLEVPFDELSTRFPPAAEWGRNLYRYLGGERAVDASDAEGRPTLQRERMVIRPPWYAVGAPDIDMSKYETVSYAPDEIRVDWMVAASQNRSVLRDDGFVSFRRLAAKTLVVFSSIHEVDPGWLGRALPAGLRMSIALKTLRDLFGGHVRTYRERLRAA